MSKLSEILSFRQFITPYVLHLLFWAAIAGTLCGAWLFSHDNCAWIMAIVFGPLLVHLIFESFILRYQTYMCLHEIRTALVERS